MMAIFKQRVFDGLRALTNSAVKTVLFLGDPVAAAVLPMKTMVDAELHDGGSTSFKLALLLVTSNACSRAPRLP